MVEVALFPAAEHQRLVDCQAVHVRRRRFQVLVQLGPNVFTVGDVVHSSRGVFSPDTFACRGIPVSDRIAVGENHLGKLILAVVAILSNGIALDAPDEIAVGVVLEACRPGRKELSRRVAKVLDPARAVLPGPPIAVAVALVLDRRSLSDALLQQSAVRIVAIRRRGGARLLAYQAIGVVVGIRYGVERRAGLVVVDDSDQIPLDVVPPLARHAVGIDHADKPVGRVILEAEGLPLADLDGGKAPEVVVLVVERAALRIGERRQLPALSVVAVGQLPLNRGVGDLATAPVLVVAVVDGELAVVDADEIPLGVVAVLDRGAVRKTFFDELTGGVVAVGDRPSRRVGRGNQASGRVVS